MESNLPQKKDNHEVHVEEGEVNNILYTGFMDKFTLLALSEHLKRNKELLDKKYYYEYRGYDFCCGAKDHQLLGILFREHAALFSIYKHNNTLIKVHPINNAFLEILSLDK